MKTHRILAKPRQFLTVAAVISALSLVACGAEDSAPNAEPAETTEVELVDVDPETFAVASGYVFAYQLDDSRSECVINEAAASCFANVADDVPDIEIPPFPPREPGAVTTGADGVDYTLVEGVPPAQETLEVGQRVSVGNTECLLPDASTLRCTHNGTGFTITGSDREVELDEEPIGRYFIDNSDSESAVPSAMGSVCGDVTSSEFEQLDGNEVMVVDGEVDCAAGLQVIDMYLNTPVDPWAGNINAQEIDGWYCSMPTAARSAELALAALCDMPDAGRLGVVP